MRRDTKPIYDRKWHVPPSKQTTEIDISVEHLIESQRSLKEIHGGCELLIDTNYMSISCHLCFNARLWAFGRMTQGAAICTEFKPSAVSAEDNDAWNSTSMPMRISMSFVRGVYRVHNVRSNGLQRDPSCAYSQFHPLSFGIAFKFLLVLATTVSIDDGFLSISHFITFCAIFNVRLGSTVLKRIIALFSERVVERYRIGHRENANHRRCWHPAPGTTMWETASNGHNNVP